MLASRPTSSVFTIRPKACAGHKKGRLATDRGGWEAGGGRTRVRNGGRGAG